MRYAKWLVVAFLFSVFSSSCVKHAVANEVQEPVFDEALPEQPTLFDLMPRYNRFSSPVTNQVLGTVSLLILLNNLTQQTRSGGNRSLLGRIYNGNVRELLVLARQVFVLGCVGYALKFSWDICSYGATHAPQMYRFMRGTVQRLLDMCAGNGRPFDAAYLHILEQLFASVGVTLSGQTVIDSCELSVVRGNDQTDKTNWHYVVLLITQSFDHIIAYLTVHMAYYQQQRPWLLGEEGERSKGIVFITQTIINNLRHLTKMCARASCRDDIDTHHARQIGRNTLLLFKKLRMLVRGSLAIGEVQSEHALAHIQLRKIV